MRFLTTFFLLASSLVFAQDYKLYGVFAHYARSSEWTTTVYFNVEGKSYTSPNCNFRLDFYNQRGMVAHSHTFTTTSDYFSTPNLYRYDVPDFNFGQLAVGPVLVFSTCTDSYGINQGELVFTQTVNGKTNDGSVSFKSVSSNYFATPEMILDTTRYSYGFAVFNNSPDAKVLTYSLYDQTTKTDRPEKILITLAGMEQRIFVLQDLVADLKPGLYRLELKTSPSVPKDVFILSLKFNFAGSFSTGVMVD